MLNSRFALLLSWTLLVPFAVSTLRVQAKDGQETADSAGVAFFESKVRPILVKHCYECHSLQSGVSEGELRLDVRQAVRSGGSRGPAVVPGEVQSSWLLKAISHEDPDLKMPPKRSRLPDTVIADMKRWIEMGAPDPRDERSATVERLGSSPQSAESHWAYQRLRDHVPPKVVDVEWPRQRLDYFVLSELEKNELRPSPDAEPHVLIRRLHFDLSGLPPAPTSVKQFVQRIAQVGVERALEIHVDGLLASPQFAERWGRHWLDVSRFAESSGKEANISFPYAWRYRDYVFDCLNADLPFSRFVIEQLAGDLLPFADPEERARLLIATGFLAIGPKNLDEMNYLQFAADVVDEQIDAMTRAFMGSSVACARCHDHKFEPFSMQDYYALAGIFTSTKTFFGTAVSPANRVGGDPLQLPRDASSPIFHKSIPAEKVAALKSELTTLQNERKEKMATVFRLVAEGKDPGDTFTIRDALRIFWRSGAIEGQLEKVDEQGQPLRLAMGVLDAEKIGDTPLLERGDIHRPAAKVARRFPLAIPVDQETSTSEISATQSGRLELARWLTHSSHPLTSRVFVNRVWHHLFGTGLVAAVDNFGASGDRPSHPELLDCLAVSFNRSGGSLKTLVREMVLSRTYRQASVYSASAFQLDPDNRLLWRIPKRRLEAEAIRDAMLAVSGELDLNRPSGSLVAKVIDDRPISLIGLDKRLPPDLDGAVHRSVYLPVIRDRLPDALDLFDFAEPSLVTGRREVTNVPTQSLYLLNSPFVLKRAESLTDRLLRDGQTNRERVQLAMELCFCRQPDDAELSRALMFLTTTWATLNSASPTASAGTNERETLSSFCQALLSTAEFRILD